MAEARKLVSFTKKITATNSAQALTTTSQVLTGVLVKAKAANVTTVKIGSSGVGATSYPMDPGEPIGMDVIDPSQIFVYGNENDEVYVLGLEP